VLRIVDGGGCVKCVGGQAGSLVIRREPSCADTNSVIPAGEVIRPFGRVVVEEGGEKDRGRGFRVEAGPRFGRWVRAR
jgi:hypothetical protein